MPRTAISMLRGGSKNSNRSSPRLLQLGYLGYCLHTGWAILHGICGPLDQYFGTRSHSWKFLKTGSSLASKLQGTNEGTVCSCSPNSKAQNSKENGTMMSFFSNIHLFTKGVFCRKKSKAKVTEE